MLIRDYIAKKHTFIKYMITRQLKNSEKTYTTPKFFCQRGSQRYLVKKCLSSFECLDFYVDVCWTEYWLIGFQNQQSL